MGNVLRLVFQLSGHQWVTVPPPPSEGFLLAAGLTAYMAICGLGAIVNVLSADYLFDHSIPWWFAGAAGALIGAVWNYAVSTQIVWTWLPSMLGKKKS